MDFENLVIFENFTTCFHFFPQKIIFYPNFLVSNFSHFHSFPLPFSLRGMERGSENPRPF